MKKLMMLGLIISSFVILLCGCQQKQSEEKASLYVKMIYKEDDPAYLKQKKYLKEVTEQLYKNYSIKLETLSYSVSDDAIVNKVLHYKENSNLFIIYDNNNRSKLLAVFYGIFTNTYDLEKEINNAISSQKDFYNINGYKYLYINNSHDIEYPDIKRTSSVSNFYEGIYQEEDKFYSIAKNYLIQDNADQLLIFDNNNNLLLLYNLENTNYYTNPKNKTINLDATIIAHVLNVKPGLSKNKIIYFYNSQDYNAQIVELNKYQKLSKKDYDIIAVPLNNNDIRTTTLLRYIKEVFQVKDTSTTIIINDFQDFNSFVKLEGNKKAEDIINYYRMKNIK